MEEEIYFMSRLSRSGEDWTYFLELPIDVSTEMQLIYV
jgi:hypothetical protein